MKIFLENKIIRLKKQPPEAADEKEKVVQYSSPEDLKNAFREFEKTSSLQRLTIWSPDHFKKLKEDFLSLFRFIGAAGGAVKNERNELLVIFRLGKWDLPKGKISSGKKNGQANRTEDPASPETPPEAAVREVMEETGLSNVTLLHELPSTYHIYFRNDVACLKRTYWYAMSATSDQFLIPQKEEDISIAKWISEEEVGSIAANTYPSLKDLILSAFQS